MEALGVPRGTVELEERVSWSVAEVHQVLWDASTSQPSVSVQAVSSYPGAVQK